MTNVMILTCKLLIFHLFLATYHLALLMVYIFHSSKDVHHAAHIMMILDITTSARLIHFCLKATKSYGLRSPLRNFMADIDISLENTRSQSRQWWMIHSKDRFNSIQQAFSCVFIVYMDLSILYFIANEAVTGVMHEADNAYSIRSIWSYYWMGQILTPANSKWILWKILSVLLDLSYIYFTCFFVVSFFYLFSGVELSIRSSFVIS